VYNKVGILYLVFTFKRSDCVKGDVEMSVIDTASVRLNLVGKRVQIAEDAEHFYMETTRKDGIVQVQGKDINVEYSLEMFLIYNLGFISDKSAGSTIDVNALKGTVELNVRDWFSTLKLDRHVDL
jgi:hypothetical protein